MTLSPALRMSRLALDGSMLMAVRSPHLVIVGARNAKAAVGGEALDEAAVLAGEADAYLMTFRFPMLRPDRTPLGEARVLFDIEHPAYPFATPSVQVVSVPRPWSPHVHPNTGIVCVGEGWVEARGQMLLAQLVAHTMRILNWDEPYRSSIDGYDVQALEHWRARGCRPLNSDLRYPALPEDRAFGLPVEHPVFRAVGASSRSARAAFRQVTR